MSKKNNLEKDAKSEEMNVDDNKAADEKVDSNQCDENTQTNQSEETAAETKSEGSPEDEELNVKYLRLAADFQNFRRRVEKEKSDIYAYANEKIVIELLAVIDNFERALEHSVEGAEAFSEGMGKIFKQLKGVLEKSGVEEIPAIGEDFDPNFHHAVLTENTAEYESGKVSCVLQKGYLLNTKVIRPAMVKVAE